MPVSTTHNDNDLLALIRRDDEDAFRALYDRYWNKLLMQAYLKTKSYEESEEIVQDAFVGLWRRRSSIQIKNSFYTYISSVVKYEILRRLAARKAKNDFERDAALVYTEEDNCTQQWLSYEELRIQIEATIQTLPEKCRMVFRLSREAGLTEKQIANKLHIAPKTVEAHKSKALKVLRTSLAHLLGAFLSLFILIMAILQDC